MQGSSLSSTVGNMPNSFKRTSSVRNISDAADFEYYDSGMMTL